MNKSEITNVVIEQVKQLNETLPESQKFIINNQTVLFGEGSRIDSLSLVSVIVDLETIFFDEYGYEISLTDDKAMTRAISPFDNIQNLIDYIDELINPK